MQDRKRLGPRDGPCLGLASIPPAPMVRMIPHLVPATYDSDWDVMSGGQSLDPYPGGYGYLGVHTIAYHKDFLGWIPPARKYTAAPNSTRTIPLERLAQPGEEGYLMAQIPIGRVADRLLHGRGAAVCRLRRWHPGRSDCHPYSRYHAGQTGWPRSWTWTTTATQTTQGAMWTVGEIFTDTQRMIPPDLHRRGLRYWLPRDHQHES